MTEEKQVYSVAELVDAVGVPRTTINDWLARYAKYIDFETRGKRKVYFPSSVAVLREISGLRNAGKSSFEIEDELMRNHPLRPDPVDHPDVPPPEAGAESQALVRQMPAEEIAKIFNHEIQSLSSRLENYDQLNNHLRTGLRRIYLPMIVGFLVLFAVGLLAIVVSIAVIQNYNAKQTEAGRAAGAALNARLEAAAESLSSANRGDTDRILAAQAEKFDALMQQLSAERLNSANNLDKLRGEFLEERRQFAAEMEKVRQSLLAQKQSELQTLRADFERQLQERDQRLKQLQEKLAQTEDALSQLRNRPLEPAGEPDGPAAEAAPPATPAPIDN